MSKKQEYWNHFLTLKNYWGHGVTLKRLEKIKDVVFEDDDFWSDILLRHSGNQMTPLEMKGKSDFNYKHCFGNMAGMIYHIMVEMGIL